MILKYKFKHSLCHVLLTLVSLGICMLWTSNAKNWSSVGTMRDCAILPVLFAAEFAKVMMARYYGNYLNEVPRNPLVFDIHLPQILGRVVVHILAVLVYTCGCIALGASQIEHFEQTLIISLMLTFKTVTPIVMLFDGFGLMQVIFCEPFRKPATAAELTSLDLIKYSAVGGVLGAWIGSAVGMAYNWTHAWLSYPIPNVYGILAGSAVANTFGLMRVVYEYVRDSNVKA